MMAGPYLSKKTYRGGQFCEGYSITIDMEVQSEYHAAGRSVLRLQPALPFLQQPAYLLTGHQDLAESCVENGLARIS